MVADGKKGKGVGWEEEGVSAWSVWGVWSLAVTRRGTGPAG